MKVGLDETIRTWRQEEVGKKCKREVRKWIRDSEVENRQEEREM